MWTYSKHFTKHLQNTNSSTFKTHGLGTKLGIPAHKVSSWKIWRHCILVGVLNFHWSKFLANRESRKLVLIIVAIALLLDNMLLTTVGELTEYTQSGNGCFLAYILLWLKNQPRLVRVGGDSPPPFTVFTITSIVAVRQCAARYGSVCILKCMEVYGGV